MELTTEINYRATVFISNFQYYSTSFKGKKKKKVLLTTNLKLLVLNRKVIGYNFQRISTPIHPDHTKHLTDYSFIQITENNERIMLFRTIPKTKYEGNFLVPIISFIEAYLNPKEPFIYPTIIPFYYCYYFGYVGLSVSAKGIITTYRDTNDYILRNNPHLMLYKIAKAYQVVGHPLFKNTHKIRKFFRRYRTLQHPRYDKRITSTFTVTDSFVETVKAIIHGVSPRLTRTQKKKLRRKKKKEKERWLLYEQKRKQQELETLRLKELERIEKQKAKELEIKVKKENKDNKFILIHISICTYLCENLSLNPLNIFFITWDACYHFYPRLYYAKIFNIEFLREKIPNCPLEILHRADYRLFMKSQKYHDITTMDDEAFIYFANASKRYRSNI